MSVKSDDSLHTDSLLKDDNEGIDNDKKEPLIEQTQERPS